MRITPRTEKEIAELNLWAPGVYSFQIGSATDEVSKAGNEMIKLAVNVYNAEGTCKIVYDYLLETIPHKIRHLCEACGLLDKYESTTIYAQDFEGKTGDLKLAIQKDKGSQYPDKNTIADYINKPIDTTGKGAPKDNNTFDDSIPF